MPRPTADASDACRGLSSHPHARRPGPLLHARPSARPGGLQPRASRSRSRARQPELELRIRQPRPAAGLAGGSHAACFVSPAQAHARPSPVPASEHTAQPRPWPDEHCIDGRRSAIEFSAHSLSVLMRAHCRCWASCFSLRDLASVFSCATS